jgi:tetratricopeptide (TPR) repeat protein
MKSEPRVSIEAAAPPRIFLSYSHRDKDVADSIDVVFSSIGIRMLRDVRDVPYRHSFKEYMQQIRETDFVVMIISDSYLKSLNCMYEVTEFIASQGFQEKLLPVMSGDPGIFSPSGRIEYIRYWKRRLMALTQESISLEGISHGGTITSDLKLMTAVCQNLDTFFNAIKDNHCKSFADLKSENYRSLIDQVGFEDLDLLKEVIRIRDLENREQQDMEMEEFLAKYPRSTYGLFYRANISENRGEFLKAIKYYQDAIAADSKNLVAQLNYGGLLATHLHDYKGARAQYERVLAIDPSFALADLNLGIICGNQLDDSAQAMLHFKNALAREPTLMLAYAEYGAFLTEKIGDCAAARAVYETALNIDPDNSGIITALASLLAFSLNDANAARALLEKTIDRIPGDVACHLGYGVLLSEHFQETEAARKQFEQCISIDSTNSAAHMSLAILLENSGDPDGAKRNYERSILLQPDSAFLHYAFGNLLVNHFKDYKTAGNHFLKTVEIDPNHALAHYNLPILYASIVGDDIMARKHYSRAIEISPSLANEQLDSHFGIDGQKASPAAPTSGYGA